MKKLRMALAFILTMVLLAGALPASAATSADQVGSYYQADGEGGKTSTSITSTQVTPSDEEHKNKVIINKTIAGTDTENVFDITLDVKTVLDFKELSRKPDAAVVLVFDASVSMETVDSGYGGTSRMDKVRTAAKQFLTEFADVDSDVKRKVSVVAFWKDGHIICDWTDLQAGQTQFDMIDHSSLTTLSGHSGTNIEAGMRLAYNLVTEEDELEGIFNRTVILLSDGAANSSVVNGEDVRAYTEHYQNKNDWNARIHYYPNANGTNPLNNSNSYNNCYLTYHNTNLGTLDSVNDSITGMFGNADYHFHHKDAVTLADQIRSYDQASVLLHSIYCGDETEGLTNIQDTALTRDEEIQDDMRSYDCKYCDAALYDIGRTSLSQNNTIVQYLTDISDTCVATHDVDALQQAFESIEETIALDASAWRTTDVIPPNMEFLGFKRSSSKPGELGLAADGKSFIWDLRLASATEADGYYCYSLTYQVKLDTLDTNYAADTFYQTNTKADLKYFLLNEDKTVTKTETIYYNHPTVKGYDGDLSFIKVDENGAPISGATFVLSSVQAHSNGNPYWSQTATSGADGKVTFTDIPSGQKYIMKETVAPQFYSMDGSIYDVEVAWGEVTIQKRGDSTDLDEDNLSIANKRDPQLTYLEVSKIVNGVETNQAFDFVVKFTNTDGTVITDDVHYIKGTEKGVVSYQNNGHAFTLKHGETIRFDGLPLNCTYVVTEAAVDGFLTYISGDGATGVIDDAYGKSVAFTNTANKTMTVSKVLAGNAFNVDDQFEMHFQLLDAAGKQLRAVALYATASDGDHPVITYQTNGWYRFLIHGNTTVEINGIPYGCTSIELHEANLPSGYVVAYTNGDEQTYGTANEVSFTVTNTRNAGNLMVGKQVVSPSNTDKAATTLFNFTVTFEPALTGEYPYQTSDGITGNISIENGVCQFQLAHGKTMIIGNLPENTVATVTEEAVTGFETTWQDSETNDTNGENTAVVVSAKNVTVTGINTRTIGELALTKTVEQPVSADQVAHFYFDIELSDQTINGSFPIDRVGSAHASEAAIEYITFTNGKAEIYLHHGDTVTISGLPQGVDYTITERASDEYTLKSQQGNTGTISGTKDVASFINARTASGTAVIAKKVDSPLPGDLVRPFTFTATLKEANGTPISGNFGGHTFDANGKHTFQLVHGDSHTLAGLPVGAVVTFEETALPNFTVSYSDTENDDNNGENTVVVAANATVTVNAKNTRNQNGKLTIEKTVESQLDSDDEKEFTFTITLADETGKQFNLSDKLEAKLTSDAGEVDAEVVFTSGVATVKLKDGQSITIEGLPEGIGYTVEEAEYAGFDSTGVGTTGTITATGANASFLNRRASGVLVIRKHVKNGLPADQQLPFEFEITLTKDDAARTPVTGVHGALTFDHEGKATFLLKHGESIAISSLESGTYHYTVTEKHATGFGTKYTISDANNVVIKQEDKAAAENTLEAKDIELVLFENERETSSLTVSKKLVSDLPSDKEQEFQFRVVLHDKDLAGTHGDMEFVAMGTLAVANVTLKGGEWATATGLPVGTHYTVTENLTDVQQSVFTTTSTGTSGNIIEGTPADAVFTNTRKTGTFALSKKVVSPVHADHEELFAFQVMLKENGALADITQTYEGIVKIGVNELRPRSVGFTNGESEVIYLYDGQTLVIDGLPVGITAVALETAADGYATTVNNASATIDADAIPEVVFTNTRKTASLSITKRLGSNALTADQNQPFGFTVLLTGAHGTPIKGKFDYQLGNQTGEAEFGADGKYGFQLKAGETLVIKNLPIGAKYMVTETENPAFVQSSTNAEGTIVDGVSQTVFTNDREVRSLTIQKLVSGTVMQGDPTEFTFTVTLSDRTVNETIDGVTFENGIATVTVKGGDKLTINGIPANMTVSVTEMKDDRYISSGDTNGFITLENGQNVLTFENQRKNGELIIHKYRSGALLPGDPEQFTFVVTLDQPITGKLDVNGTEYTLSNQNSFEVMVQANSFVTISGLPDGVMATVKEKENAVFTTTVRNGVDTVQIVYGQPASVRFDNIRKQGSLVVKKSVHSTMASDLNEEYTFTLTLKGSDGKPLANATYSGVTLDENGQYTFTLKHNQSRVFNNLPTGASYVVTEKTVDGMLTSSTGEVGVVSGEHTAHYTNTRPTGSLSVTKTLGSHALLSDRDLPFSFTMKLVDEKDQPISGKYDYTIDGTAGEAEFDKNGVFTFQLKPGQILAFKELPTDAKYVVTETVPANFVNANPQQSGTIGAATGLVTFVNDRNVAGLTISKTVEGITAANDPSAFTFTITLSDRTINDTIDGVRFTNGVATVTVQGNDSVTISGIPSYLKVSVAEKKDDRYTSTGDVADAALSEQGSNLPFTNTRKTGELTISKKFSGNLISTDPATFTFDVTLSETVNGKLMVGGSEVILSNQNTFPVTVPVNDSVTVTGLPQGVEYTVTERTVEGYTLVAQSGTKGTITGSKAEASFTNARAASGTVVIAKKVDSPLPGDLVRQFTFTVTVTDANLNPVSGTFGTHTFDQNGQLTFQMEHDDTQTITDLPVGVSVKVEEAPADHFTVSYEDTEANDSNDENVVVTSGTQSMRINVKNTRNQNGKLTIEKEVVSQLTSDNEKEFTFTITLADENGKRFNLSDTLKADMSGVEVPVVFTSGVATVKLKDGQSITINGLPEGIRYTVDEAEYAGFTSAPSSTNGDITANGTTARFTNTRAAGVLVIRKHVESELPEDRQLSFDFEIKLTDTAGNAVTGKHGALTFDNNGKAVFSLKHGESIAISSLDSGNYHYTVTEKHATGFSTTYTISNANANAAPGEQPGATADGTLEVADIELVLFKNVRQEGSLTVSKKLDSDLPSDKDQEFKFVVELSNPAVTGKRGDMVFVAMGNKAVAEVTLKGGEWATATGLPEGITYTVREVLTSAQQKVFTTASTGATGNIDGTPDDAVFTNTRNPGTLTLSKKVTSAVHADHEKLFAFKVTLLDEAGNVADITQTYVGQVQTGPEMVRERHTGFTKGVSEVIYLHSGQALSVSGLPVGITAKVEETAEEGFTAAYSPANGTVTIGDAPVQVEVTNARSTSSLSVTKQLGAHALASDQNKAFDFTIQLTGAHGAAVSGNFGYQLGTQTGTAAFDADGKYSFQLKANETLTINDLPIGALYSVTEAADSTFVQSTNGKEDGVIATGAAEVIFTNDRPVAGLTIQKTVKGAAAAGDPTEFTFKVELSDHTVSKQYGDVTFVDGVGSVTLKDGETATITDMPKHLKVTVTEVKNDLYTSAGDAADIVLGEEGKVLPFVNTRKTGGLTIEKTVEGDLMPGDPAAFTFDVKLDKAVTGTLTVGQIPLTLTNENAFTVSVPANGTLSISGIPSGVKATVTEKENEKFATTLVSSTNTVEIGSNEMVVVSYKNVRRHGGLTVKKTVVSDIPGDKTRTFNFTLALEGVDNAVYGGVTFASGKYTFALADGQEKLFTGLPTGLKYTVTEETDGGFVVTRSGDTGEITGEAQLASFTNTRSTGSLMVSKKVQGTAADQKQAFDFTFTFTDADGNALVDQYPYTGTLNGSDAVNGYVKSGDSLKLAHGAQLSISLPEGSKYTVQETNAYGYLVSFETGTTGITDANKASVTGEISKEVSSALFVNTLNTGATIQKISAGLPVGMTYPNPTLTIYSTADNSVVWTDTLVSNSAPVQLPVKLPAGEYRIEETVPAVKDYSCTASLTVNDQAQLSNIFVVTDGVTAVSLKVVNTYLAQFSYLTIEKHITGAAANTNDVFSFTLTLTDAQGMPIEGLYPCKVNGQDTNPVGHAGIIKLRGGDKAVLQLPAGARYKVEETDAAGYRLMTSSGTEGVMTTGAASSAIASFTNERNPGLTVRKVWVGGNGVHPASVTVQLMRNGAAVGDPVVLGELNHWTYTWDNLPYVGGYTVAETEVPAGYTASVTHESDNVVVITNTIKVGPPQTGDDSNLMLWALLTMASAVCMYSLKKRKA